MAAAAPQLTVTPAAEKFMRRMVRFSGSPQGGFRLRVKPGGCSGLASEFSVEAAPVAGDAELSVNGLRLFLPVESRLLLDGVTVDFSDSLAASGLSFFDPKSTGATCGSSASASAPPAMATVSLSSLKRTPQSA